VKRRKENIVLENVAVTDYAAEGKSLAKVDGKVIFIEGAVPGDILDIRLLKNKKDWAEARPLRFISYSPERETPFCSHFGVCGGCQWQMLPYEKQLIYKQKQVADNLQRIGKLDLPAILPIMDARQTRFYRNKIEYTFGTKEFTISKPQKEPMNKGTPAPANGAGTEGAAGFHAKGFFDKIVNIETCYLQAEPTNEIRLAVKEFALENRYPFYDIRNHTGFLRTMQVRLCTTGELMVNIVVAEDDKEKTDRIMRHISDKFPGITTLLYTVNKKWNDSLHDLVPVPWKGSGYVIEKLSNTYHDRDFEFKIGPTSFFQTNSKQAQKVIGVELIPAAIDDARQNAALNHLSHTSFFAGDVIDICDDAFFAEHGKPDVIITDPPRAGMHEKLVKKILGMNAPVVVYVSCNPATQARDLKLLNEKYAVTKIQPVDMFPHTHHIENVVQLKLR
jgi:23S rRNA (uracil1939-C5)-methyltransferase